MAEGNGATRDVAEGGDNALQTGMPGSPSRFTCPDCGGALWELRDGKLVKYRCHVGHGYTPDGLVAAQSEALETALWGALRALEENADLRRRMARRAAKGNWPQLVRQYEQQASETEDRATVIRNLLLSERIAENPRPPLAPQAQRRTGPKKKQPPARRGNGRHANGAAAKGAAAAGRKSAGRPPVPAAPKVARPNGRGTRDNSTVPVRGSGK